MAREWKYTLEAGEDLRFAIDREDPEGVLDALEACFIEINQEFPEEYTDEELSDDLDEITNIRDNLENYDEYEMVYDDVVDDIDYFTNELYDLCDALRIWVDGV